MVRWTAHAKSQLRLIHNYIADNSPFYAKRVVTTIVQRTASLDQLPHQGRVVPEINEESVRELPLYSYRILYEMQSENQIAVLAVIHKRQNLAGEDVPREY